MRPKVTFVIHRYSADIAGGAEQYCRRVAERMCRHWDLDIVTTCARDYLTWANEFPAGTEELDGIRVLRFPVAEHRDMKLFNRRLDAVLAGSTLAEQEEWMRAQGPYSPALLEHLRSTYRERDLFIFFSYLYAHTYFGLPLVADKAVLVPMAHDEPMIRLEIYRSVFGGARRLLFLTPEEKKLVRSRFPIDDEAHPVVGIGCEMAPYTKRNPEVLSQMALPKPYGIYVGRVDASKGMSDFFHYFVHSRVPLDLVVVGDVQMEIPDHHRIHYLGFVSEEVKVELLKNAEVLFLPSPYESLSLSVLEAWQAGIPALVNGGATVLAGQCERSGGGVIYRSQQEFVQALHALMESRARRVYLGLLGRRYVRRTCSWPIVEGRYLETLEEVTALRG